MLVVSLVALAVLAPRPVGAGDIAEAVTALKRGQYEECAAMAREAIESGQYSETWRTLKIEADLAMGRHEDALTSLDDALQRYRTSVRLRWLGATVCRLNGQTQRAREMLDEIDLLTDGYSWRYSDPASRVALGRYYLAQGQDAKQVLDGTFGWVKQRQPNYTDAYIASGQLALSKNDFGLAADEFESALQLDATDPDIYFGLARAYAASDVERSEAFLQEALQRNPRHADSLLLLIDSHIDAERYAEAEVLLSRVLAVNPREARAWAYHAVLAHLRGDEIGEYVCRELALAGWSQNPRVDYLIGRKLSDKYRFAEGADHQRQALQFDPDFHTARFQLAQDLLRLGHEEEGLQLAREVFARDAYNVVAHNLVELQNELANFETLESDGFLLRMERREAALYGKRMLELLERARRELCSKYDVTIDEPVLVEVFPRQADFAIRTFGLPGGDGFLGVCFGRVITANSPASRSDSPANWESVMWHEFCHVVTLEKTRNRMPRWLSEGISVYEERQANPSWGQTMTPEYREFILGGAMPPVSRLSGAFLDPASPLHLQFAYFQSSLVVEFLVDKYGLETLRRILVDLGAGMPINESLARYAGSLDLLDAEFAAFARLRAEQLAAGAEFDGEEIPRGSSPTELADWLDQRPNDFSGQLAGGAALVAAERWEAAKAPLKRAVELYPDYHEGGGAYALLADVHRQLGETSEERAVLERLAELSDDAADAYTRLIELCLEDEDWTAAMAQAERLMAVNPLIVLPHEAVARAARQLGDDARAVDALRALVELEPIDPADVHFRLARSLLAVGDVAAARRETLKSLEEAPRFLAAHQQLLDIVGRSASAAESNATDAAPPPAAQPVRN